MEGFFPQQKQYVGQMYIITLLYNVYYIMLVEVVQGTCD